MPFIPNTPESLLGRSDSKNPAITCRGITSGGRPCRRPNEKAQGAKPALLSPKRKTKAQVAVDPSDPDNYCWQHRDQASRSAHSSPGPGGRTPIAEERESMDELIGRLGIQEKKKRQETMNQMNQNNQQASQGGGSAVARPPVFKVQKQRSLCCCFTITVEEEEEQPPARPAAAPLQNSSTQPASAPAKPVTSKPPSNQRLSPSMADRPGPGSKKNSTQSDVSQTSQYLSLIPPTVSPQTASQLMAELAKPISQQDEPGYIYIFWLTPESKSTPKEAAQDLLKPPAQRQRRNSDVINTYATQKGKGGKKSKTILLKIGRASNVQRRLNEWTRQCGYDLSLIRYYPYVSENNPTTPRKMPHSHKVERLIHLELTGAGLRVSDKGECEACGKAHKEWFEVDATREAIEMIDEVVKRWSDWDEAHP
ncbi:meiotically up-regulated gene 113-domain-containing protein [Xylariomycetidae sp. FL0641]|nr:meiotically up-regulated gene 113-domain-containing protein [Xylariomycetidae sp. FL0641]